MVSMEKVEGVAEKASVEQLLFWLLQRMQTMDCE